MSSSCGNRVNCNRADGGEQRCVTYGCVRPFRPFVFLFASEPDLKWQPTTSHSSRQSSSARNNQRKRNALGCNAKNNYKPSSSSSSSLAEGLGVAYERVALSVPFAVVRCVAVVFKELVIKIRDRPAAKSQEREKTIQLVKGCGAGRAGNAQDHNITTGRIKSVTHTHTHTPARSTLLRHQEFRRVHSRSASRVKYKIK